MLADLFTNPDRFFEHVSGAPGLVRPALVVAVLGVASGLSGLPSAQATARALPAEAQAFAGFAYVSTVIGGFIGAFVVWGVYAGVFHLIASYGFDGDGSFRETAAATAWGLAPAVLSAVVSGVLTWFAFQSIATPTDPSQLQSFLAQVRSNPYFLTAGIVGIAFLLWQAFLWTFGVRHVHHVTLREAAISVALPVVVALLFRISGLF